MAIDHTALAAELTADPTLLGYTPLILTGSDGAIADLMNAVRQDIDIDRDVIPSYEIIDATLPSEWSSLNAAEKQRYQTITGAGQVNVQAGNTRSMFAAMFGPLTVTRANLIAIQTRKGSRAEQLFGSGVTIRHEDIAQALRG